MQDAKEEIRARLSIEDVIGEYVQLKRAGRSFKGLSPFTSERTPSFVVSPEKNIWHDFSSSKGGDIFTFIMEVEGLDFRGAIELLARKAGVDLSQYSSKEAGATAKKKRRLLEANELAGRYYQQSLLRNKHALEYVFAQRKLSKDVVQEFGIGYAPSEGDALVQALLKKDFTRKELAEAGLTNRYGGDIFRGRMTVPLMDGSGQVIGFTGRILEENTNGPKYLNTPQTLIYDKSRHVFGLSQAKEAIRKADEAVIVEGNLDVVSSHQVGIKQVVATAGTAMTEWHLKAISRLTHMVKLAFDGDKAGLAATERAIPIAQAVGVELRIVTLPNEAKDPDELIQHDVALWERAIREAKPVVDWVLEQYSKRYDLGAADGKRKFTTATLAVIASLGDVVEAEHYLGVVATMTSTSVETLKRKLAGFERDNKAAALKPIKSTSASSVKEEKDTYLYQDMVLAALIAAPDARKLLSPRLIGFFQGDNRQQLAQYLEGHHTAWSELPPELKEVEVYVRMIELKAETRYEDWTEVDLQLEVARLLRQMEVEHKKQTTETLLTRLRNAEESGQETEAEVLRQQLHELIKETGRG